MIATSEVLERVYVLPSELRARLALGCYVSLWSLVAETDYPTVRGEVDVEVLRSGLCGREVVLQDWLRYSSEKTASWGWFFEVDRRGKYAVGLKTGFSEKTRCEILDPWEACAYFIKEELDAIVGSVSS